MLHISPHAVGPPRFEFLNDATLMIKNWLFSAYFQQSSIIRVLLKIINENF